MENLEERINTLAQWIYDSKYLVVFTGAGISTESGLPDFRGPDGVWTRQAKGLTTKSPPFATLKPNSGHIAIVDLQNLGKLKFLISQNVDNLHLKSGIRPDLLAELHGNVTKLRCSQCDFLMDNFDDIFNCPLCGGKLASSVVNFGQSLRQNDLDNAYRHSRNSDLFIVVGSSLVVMPAADMPREALRAGAKLVIINEGETPLDSCAQLRFHEKIGRVLPEVVGKVKEIIKIREKNE